MKNKRILILSIIQIMVGILAVLGFIAALLFNENMIKWTITLILGVIIIIFGVINLILDYKSNK